MNYLNYYISFFNNRELAFIIWFILFFIFIIFHGKIRLSLINLSKAFFKLKIQIVLLLMIFYVSLIVLLLYKINLWIFPLIKDTIFWIFGTAFVLLINVEKISKEESYFKKLFLDNIKLVLILEFIVNIYTFSLWFEIILIPIITIIVVMNALAGTKEEFGPVKKLTDGILAILGITILGYTIVKISGDFRNLATSENILSFLLPILLSITYLPFLYLFTLAITYEMLFMRLNFIIKDNKKLAKFAKKKILCLCHFNLKKINKFSKEQTISFQTLNDKEAILTLIDAFKGEYL